MNKKIVVIAVSLTTITLSLLLSYIVFSQIEPQAKIVYANNQNPNSQYQYIRDYSAATGYMHVSATGNFIIQNNKISIDCQNQNEVLNRNNVPFEEEKNLPPYIFDSYIDGYQCPKQFGRGELYIYDTKTKTSQPIHYPADTQGITVSKNDLSKNNYRVVRNNYSSDGNFYLKNTNIKMKTNILTNHSNPKNNYGIIILGWLQE